MNTVTCPRCGLMFIVEEYRAHKCKEHVKGVKSLGIDFYYEAGTDENGDKLLMVKGIDGFLYRFVKCDHQIPHNMSSTDFEHREDQPSNEQNLIF